MSNAIITMHCILFNEDCTISIYFYNITVIYSLFMGREGSV